MSRADLQGWALSKEFAAMAVNISRRREQMLGVYQHVVSNRSFQRDFEEIRACTPKDFVNVAIRHALEKHNVKTKVKSALRNMR